MTQMMTCPSCGAQDIDLRSYESMMVLRPDMALFSLQCPHCATRISSLGPIPPYLREEVQCAAIEVGAGMGKRQA